MTEIQRGLNITRKRHPIALAQSPQGMKPIAAEVAVHLDHDAKQMQPSQKVCVEGVRVKEVSCISAPDQGEHLLQGGIRVPIPDLGNPQAGGLRHPFRYMTLIPSTADVQPERQRGGQVHGPRSGPPPWPVISGVPSGQDHGQDGPFDWKAGFGESRFHGRSVPVRGRLDEPKAQHAIVEHAVQGSVRVMFGEGQGLEFGDEATCPRAVPADAVDDEFGPHWVEDAARFQDFEIRNPWGFLEGGHHGGPSRQVGLGQDGSGPGEKQ